MSTFLLFIRSMLIKIIEYIDGLPKEPTTPMPPGESPNEPSIPPAPPAEPKPEPKVPPRSLLIWVLEDLHESWREKAVAKNIERLYIKCFDSLSGDKIWGQFEQIPTLIKRGFSIGTWSYEFTTNQANGKVMYPNKELITENLNKLAAMGVTHHIFDLEGELENNAERLAVMIETMKYVRANMRFPMTFGFTSFGWASKHPGFPYKALAPHFDFHAPQIYTCYWGIGHKALTTQLLAEFEAMNLGIPTYPMISTENGTNVPYPLTEADLQGLLDEHEGALVWRMHDANNSTAVTLKADYHGKLNPNQLPLPPPAPTPATSMQTKLHAFYSVRANYDKVYNSVMAWFGTTSNGCVAFNSEAVRQSGVDNVPKKVDSRGESVSLVTRPYRNYLEQEKGWTRVTDPNVLVPGDICFSQDEPGWPDYPAHVFMFDAWVNKPLTATVIDNRNFKYVRNIKGGTSYTPFAYAVRPK